MIVARLSPPVVSGFAGDPSPHPIAAHSKPGSFEPGFPVFTASRAVNRVGSRAGLFEEATLCFVHHPPRYRPITQGATKGLARCPS